MRIVYTIKFLPLTYQYGQVSVQRFGILEFLNELNRILEKANDELLAKVGKGRIVSTSISIAQVSVGPIVGLLIIVYAVVEDSNCKLYKDQS